MKDKSNEPIYVKLLLKVLIICSVRIPLFAGWVVLTFLMWFTSDNWYVNWIELYAGICIFGLTMVVLFILKVFIIILTNKENPIPIHMKVILLIFPDFGSFYLFSCYTKCKKWIWKEYYKECRAEWEKQQKNSNELSSKHTSNNIVENNKQYDTINLRRLQYWFENVSVISINEVREVYRIGIEKDKNTFLKDYLIVKILTNIQDSRTIIQQVYDPFCAYPSVDFMCIYSLNEHQHRPIFSFKYYYHWEHNNYFCSYFKTFIGMVHFIQKHFPEYRKKRNYNF